MTSANQGCVNTIWVTKYKLNNDDSLVEFKDDSNKDIRESLQAKDGWDYGQSGHIKNRVGSSNDFRSDATMPFYLRETVTSSEEDEIYPRGM